MIWGNTEILGFQILLCCLSVVGLLRPETHRHFNSGFASKTAALFLLLKTRKAWSSPRFSVSAKSRTETQKSVPCVLRIRDPIFARDSINRLLKKKLAHGPQSDHIFVIINIKRSLKEITVFRTGTWVSILEAKRPPRFRASVETHQFYVRSSETTRCHSAVPRKINETSMQI